MPINTSLTLRENLTRPLTWVEGDTNWKRLIANDQALDAEKQPISAKLTALAASVWAANQMQYFSGTGAVTNFATVAFGRAWLNLGSQAAMRTYLGLGTAALANVTTSATDTTANASLKVGDFGIGVVGTPPTLADVNSITAATGLYRVAAPTGTMPPGAGTYGTLIYERNAASLIKMTYTVNGDSASLPGSTWIRTYNPNASPAAWNAWQRIAVASELSAWGINSDISNAANISGYLADIDSFTTPNGLYVSDSNSTGTKPTGQTWGVVLVMGRNFSVGRVVQVWYQSDNATGSPRAWKRLNYGKVWSTWVEDTTQTILDAALALKENSLPVGGTTSDFLRGDKTWQSFGGMTRSQPLTGLSTATATDVVPTDTILAGIGKLQGQLIAPTSVARGGTGANNAAGARTNLGLKAAAVADILGTVSQTSGVPTGAILEYGSNSNGSYTKFADGTVIIRGGGSVDQASLGAKSATFTLPLTLVGAFHVNLNITQVNVSNEFKGYSRAANASSTTFQVIHSWDVIQTYTYQWVIVGRWF